MVLLADRPNEFVTSDFIYEGLVEWDATHPNGEDGTAGNEDDFVKPVLAISWTANSPATSSDAYTIDFTLRSGVTFHDGSAWDAAACKANFDQILGGDGSPGGVKAMLGIHDWLGFTQSIDGWEVVDSMTFRITFSTYYENALRELAIIRPFRMISPASLPNMANMELSHNKWRNPGGSGWIVHPPRFVRGYTFRGVSNPIGTGPYKVIHKKLVTTAGFSRNLPAADFNASCYFADRCTYNAGEWVAEVLFQKHAGHWKEPSYDNIIFRAFNSVSDIKNALQNGTLDLAYGVDTLSPSGFISLATAEEGSGVVAHIGQTNMNTRLIVLNSGGRLNTKNLRKLVMGVLTPARTALYNGELAEEHPTDTHFDPVLPYCGVLDTLSSPSVLAATMDGETGSGETMTIANSITRPLRFMYIRDLPHHQIIAAEIIATLYANNIAVTPMPVSKNEYNNRHCDYLGDPNGTFPYWYSYNYGDAAENYHSWDIAISETWGAPYDAAAKLWDMTHGVAGWCSQEADAPAVSNMESMDYSTFASNVRGLSTTLSATARQAAYDTVLTTLHSEAIFLPLTSKRQTAVTSTSVGGFRFGYLQYDVPLANLRPAAAAAPDWIVPVIIAAIIVVILLMFICFLISKEKAGKPVFTNLDRPTGSPSSVSAAA